MMKHQLAGKGKWDIITGTRVAPVAPAENAAYADRAMYEERLEKYNKACSEIQVEDPKIMWDTLRTELTSDDEARTATLVNQFMTMTKPPGMPMREFAQKLRNLQKQTVSVTVTPEGMEQTTNFVNDYMFRSRIFKNADPEFEALTCNLQADNTLKFGAEKAAQAKKLDVCCPQPPPQQISRQVPEVGNAFYANRGQSVQRRSGSFQQMRPALTSLPEVPTNWEGQGCWYHNNMNHPANICNSLGIMQRQWLIDNKTPIEYAEVLYGYAHPSLAPLPKGTKFKFRNVRNNRSQPQQLITHPKRKRCGLCGKGSHITDDCPKLANAASEVQKAMTTGSAMVVANRQSLNSTIDNNSDDDFVQPAI
ncbi:hypothetical protein EDC01DRAFT_630813 [Geopyxis carbonaria]|nr:hypothetical protein EDC01DRAFT_630813 [Geopyxis carbonaria]